MNRTPRTRKETMKTMRKKIMTVIWPNTIFLVTRTVNRSPRRPGRPPRITRSMRGGNKLENGNRNENLGIVTPSQETNGRDDIRQVEVSARLPDTTIHHDLGNDAVEGEVEVRLGGEQFRRIPGTDPGISTTPPRTITVMVIIETNTVKLRTKEMLTIIVVIARTLIHHRRPSPLHRGQL